MELADVGRALRAHRLLVAVLLLATVAAAVATFVQARLPYETTAAMVVLSPTKQVATGAVGADEPDRVVNPFLNFGGSQETAAQVLAVRMSDDEVGRRFEEAGVAGEWTFAVRGDSGSVIEVVASGRDAASSRASADAILAGATEEFATLQREAGAPDEQLIRVSVVNTPSIPQPVYDTKVRMAVLVAALGVVLTVALVLAVEGIARARRRGEADGGATGASGADAHGGGGPVLDDDWDDDDLDLDLLDDAFLDDRTRRTTRPEPVGAELDEDLVLDGLLADDPGTGPSRRPRPGSDHLRPAPSMFHRSRSHDLLRQR